MIVYEEDRSLYLNLTNRCPTACRFCVKKDWDWEFNGADLRIRGPEPTVDELLQGLKDKLRTPGQWQEVVFCGFGECVYRLAEMSAVGLHLKIHYPGLRVRLNTIGLGGLIWGRDIVPELALYLDEASVSLNTADPEQWLMLHQPAPLYRAHGFSASRHFAERCVTAGIKTRVTAVRLPEVRLEPLADYARRIGASFDVRPLLTASGRTSL